MKIHSLRLSNILSFNYYQNKNDIPKILFKENLNIIIGQNGSGKSTAMEALNFLLKKVLFRQYNNNFHQLEGSSNWPAAQRKGMIQPNYSDTVNEFRLEPNWSTDHRKQTIIVDLELDNIDLQNLNVLNHIKDKLVAIATSYSPSQDLNFDYQHRRFEIEIVLNKAENTFSIMGEFINDPGFTYLVQYNFFNELINFHNYLYPADGLFPLVDSFSIISSYRNYHEFAEHVNLQHSAVTQIRNIKDGYFGKSINAGENAEPGIFNLVRLKVAEAHYNLIDEAFTPIEREEKANQIPIMLAINEKLAFINLIVAVKLVDRRLWNYSFVFFDTKYDKPLGSINSLSAGQKSILHLIFEAYGRDDMKGGLIIIDEPEIHLHHQLQDEYLRIIEKINQEKSSQYILVTHSESFINSKTIGAVSRFSLNEKNHTVFHSPTLAPDINTLVKILDNTRSVYSLFARKVVFVEGDTDRYFFREVLSILRPEMSQSIALIQINGKGNFKGWKTFFESFGLAVYFIGDFDNVFNLKFADNTIVSKENNVIFSNQLKEEKLSNLTVDEKEEFKNFYDELLLQNEFLTKPPRLHWDKLVSKYRNLEKISKSALVQKTKQNYIDLDDIIESKYEEGIFILKLGALESYTNTPHAKMEDIIDFCNNELEHWLDLGTSASEEVKNIIQQISS